MNRTKDIRMSYPIGGDIDKYLSQIITPYDRPVQILRRVVLRKKQLMDATHIYHPKFIPTLADIIYKVNVKVLYQDEYPNKSVIINIIDKSIYNLEIRNKLKLYLDGLQFIEFAKLIEIVELYILDSNIT